MSDRRQEFTRIYQEDEWLGAGETRSGAGSTRQATRTLRVMLPELLHKYEVTSLLDAGCGDANWLPDYEGIEYVGVDIVAEATKECRKRHPGITFKTLDIVTGKLPVVDAIFCREVMMHLNIDEACTALNNFCASGARLLIATSFPNGKNAKDDYWVGDTWNKTGGFSTWNLEIAPFNLGPPLETLLDPGWWWRDRTGLWCPIRGFDPKSQHMTMAPVPVAQVLGVWEI